MAERKTTYVRPRLPSLAATDDIVFQAIDARVAAFHPTTGHELMLYEGAFVTMAADDDFLYTTNRHELQAWNLKTGLVVRTIEVLPEPQGGKTLRSLHVDSEARIAFVQAWGSDCRSVDDSAIYAFNMRTGKQVAKYVGGSLTVEMSASDESDEVREGMSCLAVSPTLVAAGCFDRNLYIFNRETAKRVHVLSGHGADIDAVGFVRDNSVVFSVCTADDDPLVRFFDVESGELIGAINEHPDLPYADVQNLVFTGENDEVVVCSCDSEIRVWHWPSETLLRIITLPSLEGMGRYELIEDMVLSLELHTLFVAINKYVLAFDIQGLFDVAGAASEMPARDASPVSDSSSSSGTSSFEHAAAVPPPSSGGVVRVAPPLLWSHTVLQDGMREYTNEEEFTALTMVASTLSPLGYVIIGNTNGHSPPRAIAPNTGEMLLTYVSSIGLPINVVAIDHDRGWLWIGGEERDVIAYAMHGSFPEMARLPMGASVSTLKLVPEADLLVASSSNSVVEKYVVWKLSTLEPLSQIIDDGDTDLYFNDDYTVLAESKELLLVGHDGVYRFDVGSGVNNSLVLSYPFHATDFVAPVVPTTHPEWVIAAGEGKILVFDFNSGERRFKLPVGHVKASGGYWRPESISQMVATKGYLIVAAKTIRMYSLERNLELTREIEVPGRASIGSMLVSPSTDRLYAEGKRSHRSIYAFRLSTGEKVRIYRGPHSVAWMQLAGEDKVLLGRDAKSNKLFVWDTDSDSPVAEFNDYHEGVNAVVEDRGTLYGVSTYIGFRSLSQWRRYGVVARGKCREESQITRIKDRYGSCCRFISSVIFMIISFLQLVGFAFTASIKWPDEYESVKKATQALLALGTTDIFDSFEVRFAVAAVLAGIFLCAFQVQEKFEKAKFMRPGSAVLKMGWLSFEFIMGLLASTAFLPVFQTLSGAFDCVSDPGDGRAKVADATANSPDTPTSLVCWSSGHTPMAIVGGALGLYFLSWRFASGESAASSRRSRSSLTRSTGATTP
ncbi:uncharacterized protein AMSG_06496 [Thecamonas trahens ATCC 50062]|uniref:Uncharacterized protein n=1 Tax=Thecamonas trahens ATCC 50062 TaxID=461836 RepID=A0A0L0DG99_THETB|nr:hypothetical protein AMSG_06496 [Thecamonas trahens ATCC 50062]KNC51146.1 hypothetical protein AMSG_06496 [Thecamonas trahens ATCC 50062]|eukprot:XP_013756348.1 hypothetical protein AMSG_06496 [Thecamonas trahens ATCC 50062]